MSTRRCPHLIFTPPGAGRTTSLRSLRVHPVTGPPGAGKTTALLALAAQHRWLGRFGVRDYGLELANAGHPIGLRMRDDLVHGRLVPDDLVREQFAHFLRHLAPEVTAVAVEGYPRDLRQCADLAAVVDLVGARLAELILVDVPDEVARDRVANREICTSCGSPVVEASTECPSCGGAIAPRQDDAPRLLERRLHDFRTVSVEIQSYFRSRNLLRTIDGGMRGGPDAVRTALHAALLRDDDGK